MDQSVIRTWARQQGFQVGEKKMHYHSGFNMLGYLPENDEGYYRYESAADAKQSMTDILDRHGDAEHSWVDEHDCDDIPCPTYGDSCGWNVAESLTAEMEDLNLTNVESGWDAFVGNLHYWITPCSEDHEEEE